MIISPATPSMGMRMSPSAYAPSPAPTYIRQLDGGNTLPFRAPSGSEFQVERPQRHSRRSMAPPEPVAQFGQDDGVFREDISALLAAKSRPFSVSGRIPIDPVQMQLFFRSAVRILRPLTGRLLIGTIRAGSPTPSTSRSTSTTTLRPLSTSSSPHVDPIKRPISMTTPTTNPSSTLPTSRSPPPSRSPTTPSSRRSAPRSSPPSPPANTLPPCATSSR